MTLKLNLTLSILCKYMPQLKPRLLHLFMLVHTAADGHEQSHLRSTQSDSSNACVTGSCAYRVSPEPAVIAYYTGHYKSIEKYDLRKITHLIYSFCRLKGNKLALNNPRDSAVIRNLVKLKRSYPKLKVMVALGGWGGCKTCSTVFSTEPGRSEFAASALEFLRFYDLDGLDLDWEYPAIPGFPGHPWSANDRDNFTALLQKLRGTFPDDTELSFAAGAYTRSLQQSVDWRKAALYADRIHLMTYDLRSSRHDSTGHHAPLHPTKQQEESVGYAVQYLLKQGVPPGKIVIGAAFYGRVFSVNSEDSVVLFKPGKFKRFIIYQKLKPMLTAKNGFRAYYDTTAEAAFAWNRNTNEFVTYENFRSVKAKADYVLKMNLRGIMFWELSQDYTRDGFLSVIADAFNRRRERSAPQTKE
jgi:chitinase